MEPVAASKRCGATRRYRGLVRLSIVMFSLGSDWRPLSVPSELQASKPIMTKLLISLSSFLLGSVGWYAGERFGIMTAFMLSIVGTGIGIYVGRRLAQHWGF